MESPISSSQASSPRTSTFNTASNSGANTPPSRGGASVEPLDTAELSSRLNQLKEQETVSEHFGEKSIAYDKGLEALKDTSAFEVFKGAMKGSSTLTTVLKTAFVGFFSIVLFPISIPAYKYAAHQENAAKALLKKPTADITIGMRLLADINARRIKDGEEPLDLKEILQQGQASELLSGEASVGTLLEVFNNVKKMKGGSQLDTVLKGLRKWEEALTQVTANSDFSTHQAVAALAIQNIFNRKFTPSHKEFALDQVSSLFVRQTDSSGFSVAHTKYAQVLADEFVEKLGVISTPGEFEELKNSTMEAIHMRASKFAAMEKTNARFGENVDLSGRTNEISKELHTALVRNPTFREAVKMEFEKGAQKINNLRDFEKQQNAVADVMLENLSDIARIDLSKGHGEEILATTLGSIDGALAALSPDKQVRADNLNLRERLTKPEDEENIEDLKAAFAEVFVSDAKVDEYRMIRGLYGQTREDIRPEAVGHYFNQMVAAKDVTKAFDQATTYLRMEEEPARKLEALYNPAEREEKVAAELDKREILKTLLDPEAGTEEAFANTTELLQEANIPLLREAVGEDAVTKRHNLPDSTYLQFITVLLGKENSRTEKGAATFAQMTIDFLGQGKVAELLNVKDEQADELTELLDGLTTPRLVDGKEVKFKTTNGQEETLLQFNEEKRIGLIQLMQDLSQGRASSEVTRGREELLDIMSPTIGSDKPQLPRRRSASDLTGGSGSPLLTRPRRRSASDLTGGSGSVLNLGTSSDQAPTIAVNWDSDDDE